MRNRELVRLKGMLDKLTRSQRKALATELAGLESRTASTEVVESRVPAQPVPIAPRCPIPSWTTRTFNPPEFHL